MKFLSKMEISMTDTKRFAKMKDDMNNIRIRLKMQESAAILGLRRLNDLQIIMDVCGENIGKQFDEKMNEIRWFVMK
jgi:hypothetical protein